MAFDKNKYTHNPDLDFKNVQNEDFRTYVFPPPQEGMPNSEITVPSPEAVSFKAPYSWVAGGSHRVVTKDGRSYYIPAGWIGIYWEKADSDFPAYEW